MANIINCRDRKTKIDTLLLLSQLQIYIRYGVNKTVVLTYFLFIRTQIMIESTLLLGYHTETDKQSNYVKMLSSFCSVAYPVWLGNKLVTIMVHSLIHSMKLYTHSKMLLHACTAKRICCSDNCISHQNCNCWHDLWDDTRIVPCDSQLRAVWICYKGWEVYFDVR